MRTARIRATGEAMPRDSDPANRESQRIRKTVGIPGSKDSREPPLSDADACDHARAIPPASMENIMPNVASRNTSSTEKPSDDLGLPPMSAMSIFQLMAGYEGLQTLSHVTAGLIEQPRCRGNLEIYFDELCDILNGELGKITDEMERRAPRTKEEKDFRDYILVRDAVHGLSSLDVCLEEARKRIEKVPDLEQQADQRWEEVEREAIQATRPEYTLDDLQSDVGHMYELMDTVLDTLHDMEGPRGAQRDRLGALLWIARDLSEKLTHNIEGHFREIGTSCANWPRKTAA